MRYANNMKSLKFLSLFVFEEKNRVTRILLLLTLFAGMVSFLVVNFMQFDLFENLRIYESQLRAWKKSNLVLSAIAFVLLYLSIVVFCFPGAFFLTLVGGFLFGIPDSFFYVVFSSTLGSYIVFVWVKMACPSYLSRKILKNSTEITKLLRKNAFNYLLFLRLVPLFPFWLVNLAPAILGFSGRVYFTATLIGILPGTFIYCYLGSELTLIFDSNQKLDSSSLVSYKIILLLILLAILSLLPTFFRKLDNEG